MFVSTCSLFWPLRCNVGGGNQSAGKMHGMGCAISKKGVLTARHVYAQDCYEWPVVLHDEGLWRCKVVQEWPDLDLALLEKDELVHEAALEKPTLFPEFHPGVLQLGQSLAYLAWLSTRAENGTERSVTYFGQGHVAFFDGEKEPSFALAGGVIQKGFSGGPVFSASGQLAGVLVRSFQFIANLSHPVPQPISIPIVSPVSPVADFLSRYASKT